MEALLRKLEENQQMTDEAASRLQPIEIPPKKYKSIFCIDGKPILPPLMTLEKRKEMQKFKQEAIKIERKLKKQYSRQHVCDEHNAEADESTFASLSSFCCDNISQISQISYEEADGIKQSQQKSSMLMLNDMLMIKHIDDFRNVGGADGVGDGITSNNMKSQLFTSATGLQQYNKIQKLTKSQTLIYDLTKNSEEDGKVQLKKQILEIAHEKNNSAAKYKLTKRPTYLCLNNNHNTDHSDNVGNNVPTIYINPPTPLMDEKDNITMLRKSLKTCGKHSKDSAAATTATTTTSDDSSDSQYFRGAKMNRRHSNNKTALVKAAEATAAAITSPSETSEIIRRRIKQFEEVYNQNDSPKTATASSNRSSSPEKDFRDIDSQKTNFDSLEIPSALSRSATSPSLRSTHNKNNSLPSNSVYLETPQATPESDLIRSNSFTLKVPSKALIDHMRQQQQQKQQKLQQQQQQQYFQYPTQHSHHQQIVIKSNKNNVMTRTRGLSPAKTQSRLTQDTVESKAKKKVCKVESKTSRSILQSKNSSSKFNSPSNATSLTTPSPTSSFMQYSYPSVYNSNGNNNQKNYNKSKRSPYESAASSSSSLTKSCTRKLLINSVANNASALNKSIKIQQSSCTSQKTQLQVKRQQQQQQQQQQEQQQQQQQQLQEQQQLQQQNTYDIIENSTLPIAVNLMVGEKKELFMQLLAQQEEERRKLQAAFEMQQKILLDELNESESIKYQLNNDNYHQHQHMHQYQHLQNQYYQQQPIQQHLNGNANDSQLADNSINDRMQSTPDKSTSVLSYNNSGISIRELSSMIKNESSSLTSLQNNVHNVNNYGVNNVLSSTDSFPSTSEQINVMRKTLANNNVAATSKQNSTNSINLNNSSSSLKSIKSTPRRRLFLQDMTTLNICNLKTTCNNNNNNKSITLNDGHFVDDREAAATTINAYVRGYLVRRLFQTEHIQRFVQTIRDTLIFILHLHMESIQNPQEAVKPVNVKLKGRLLQQLYSTNRRLHAVLFETTIMERMNIIAQDRKRLRNKLQKK